jgi:hypothetical protein
MRDPPSLRIARRHVQTLLTHPVRQLRNLHRERRGRLADIVHARQPGQQRPPGRIAPWQAPADPVADRPRQPLVPQPARHRRSVIQVAPQRQPAVVAPPRLGPHAPGRLGQRRTTPHSCLPSRQRAAPPASQSDPFVSSSPVARIGKIRDVYDSGAWLPYSLPSWPTG